MIPKSFHFNTQNHKPPTTLSCQRHRVWRGSAFKSVLSGSHCHRDSKDAYRHGVTIDLLNLGYGEAHTITPFKGSPDSQPASSRCFPQAVQPWPGLVGLALPPS